MNYELAKSLKDAGFPQLHKAGNHLDDPNAPEGEEPISVYEPTFSELIEACGDEFSVLANNKDGWRACSNTTTGRMQPHIINSDNKVLSYSDELLAVNGCVSPEEAVAKLWLALHRKSV